MSVKFSFSNLSLILFIGIISTVTITENLQAADGIGVTNAKLEAVMQSGQDRTLTWKIVNNSDEKIWVEVFAKGAGSEFLFFEEIIALEPRAVLVSEIIVAIPEDHPNNIEYRPQIFALQRGDPEAGKDGAATVTVNTQLRKTVTIKIGDNPIYTPPQEDIKSEAPPAVIIPEKEVIKAKTLEEKLKEIAEKNKQLLREKETVDDSFEESSNERSIEEPVMVPEPTPEPTMKCGTGAELVDGFCKIIKIDNPDDGGGCLIATAAYGTELAPQVQFLREIRDNTVLSTASGTAFMSGFNTLYYSFAPTVADLERENPMFQETVRAFITPMISTLSIMSLADEGVEEQVLGLGISVIILNIGMYIGAPIFGIIKLNQFRKN